MTGKVIIEYRQKIENHLKNSSLTFFVKLLFLYVYDF